MSELCVMGNVYPGKYEKFPMKVSMREERNGKLEMDLL